VRRLRPELWRQNKRPLHHDNAPSYTSYSTKECFTKNNISVVPHANRFSLFPLLKIQLKCRHFSTIKIIKAEPHAVLNTLTSTTSRIHLKNGRSAGNDTLRAEWNYFEGQIQGFPSNATLFHVLRWTETPERDLVHATGCKQPSLKLL
jgi:hypothetical protein